MRWTDGTAKLWLMWRVLGLRSKHPAWFEQGGYLALTAAGVKAANLCAFARPHDAAMMITIAPRMYRGLGAAGWPLGEDVWGDTRIILPPRSPHRWRNVLTGARYSFPDGRMAPRCRSHRFSTHFRSRCSSANRHQAQRINPSSNGCVSRGCVGYARMR